MSVRKLRLVRLPVLVVLRSPSTGYPLNLHSKPEMHQIFHSNTLIFQFTLKLHALLISNNAGNVDAKDESSCSQAIRTRRLTTLLTGVMCATRTNTLILGQSLILTLKTSFSKQNNHTSEESNQLLLDVVTWTAII